MVGRTGELDRLRRAWSDPARSGALVTGPPGVGKSRLVAEFLSEVEAQGANVVRAVATAATSDIPLGALASVVPTGAWTVDRQEALVELVLDGLSVRDGLVVAIDDVTLLDETSQAVVAAVLARRTGFVVATRRTGPEAADDPGRSALVGPDGGPADGVDEIELEDLPSEAVAELLEAAVGGVVAGDAAHQIWRAARGNPMLVRELTVAAEESGDLVSTDGVWQLMASPTPSPRLRELVSARLERVQPAERDVLQLLAVAGSLPAALVDRLVMPVTVEHCVHRGLAWWAEYDDLVELRLAHPIYGEVLLGDLGVLGRRRLTTRLLDAAREVPSRSIDLLRLATWQLDGGGEGDPGLLVRAARRARRLSELDLAERLLGVALARGAGEDALALLGEVQFTAGDFTEAEASYREAERLLTSRLAERAADPQVIAALGFVGIARGWNLAWGLGLVEQAKLVNHQVRERIADVDPVAAGELEAEGASYLAVTGEPLLAATLARSQAHGPPRTEVRRLHALALAVLSLGRVDEAIEVTAAGLESADELPVGFGRESFRFVFAAAHTEALLQAGRMAEAGAVAAGSYDRAVATAHLSGQALSAWARARVELERGRVDGARRWFQESAALERSLGTTRGRRQWAPVGRAMAFALAGSAAEAHQILDAVDAADAADPIDVVFLRGDVGRARARAHLAGGDREAARAELERTAEGCRANGDLALEVKVLHDRLLLADARTARSHAMALADAAAMMHGELAAARGQHAAAVLDRSASGIEASAERIAALGALRLAAEVVASGALLLDGEVSERATAALRRRSEVWLEQCGGGVAVDPDWALRRLAPRQREVVRLAAAGHSNAEIAERLGRSSRTVENHLYRAYQELGIDDRSALVDLLGPAAAH